MAQPCSGSRAMILRRSRSSVPCTRSGGLLIVSIPRLPRPFGWLLPLVTEDNHPTPAWTAAGAGWLAGACGKVFARRIPNRGGGRVPVGASARERPGRELDSPSDHFAAASSAGRSEV